jgi:hypothetical protein
MSQSAQQRTRRTNKELRLYGVIGLAIGFLFVAPVFIFVFGVAIWMQLVPAVLLMSLAALVLLPMLVDVLLSFWRGPDAPTYTWHGKGAVLLGLAIGFSAMLIVRAAVITGAI